MRYLYIMIALATLGVVMGCSKEDKPFTSAEIHDRADVKFNDQEIYDYFFSAGEGSWWAYHTYIEDTLGNILFDCYDTLHLYDYSHILETTLPQSREGYSIFYEFNDKGWNCNFNDPTLWQISVLAEKDNIYSFEGSISGKGKGLGPIYKDGNTYQIGHAKYGWAEEGIVACYLYEELIVNNITYYDVWSNYWEGEFAPIFGENDNPVARGALTGYFAKNIGLIKIANFHGNEGWETNLIDYEIIKH